MDINRLLEKSNSVLDFSRSGSFSTAKSPTQRLQDKKKRDMMIHQLQQAYGSINGIDPASPTYKALIALLDKLKQENPTLLRQIADAKIKFVSALARNRIKVKMNEDTTDEYITALMGAKGKKLQAIGKMLKVRGQSESQLAYSIFNALKSLPDTVVSDIYKNSKNIKERKNDDDDPCWDDYEQVGMKTKNGKKVPNCVPKKSSVTEEDGGGNNSDKPLNKPFRTPGGPKKFSVYVKNNKGNIVKVNFGDPNMSIKKDQPARKKSFDARHKCDQKKDKTTPGYWSCKAWE